MIRFALAMALALTLACPTPDVAVAQSLPSILPNHQPGQPARGPAPPQRGSASYDRLPAVRVIPPSPPPSGNQPGIGVLQPSRGNAGNPPGMGVPQPPIHPGVNKQPGIGVLQPSRGNAGNQPGGVGGFQPPPGAGNQPGAAVFQPPPGNAGLPPAGAVNHHINNNHGNNRSWNVIAPVISTGISGIAGRRYRSSAGTSTTWIVASPPQPSSTTILATAPPAAPAPANPEGLPELPQPIRVLNPNDATLRYLVNGQPVEHAPDHILTLPGETIWRIEFHRGGTFGTGRYAMNTGTYKFIRTPEGWDLVNVAADEVEQVLPAPLPENALE